jgi:hypothetical protein
VVVRNNVEDGNSMLSSLKKVIIKKKPNEAR